MKRGMKCDLRRRCFDSKEGSFLLRKRKVPYLNHIPFKYYLVCKTPHSNINSITGIARSGFGGNFITRSFELPAAGVYFISD
jgi:hypothetical protein